MISAVTTSSRPGTQASQSLTHGLQPAPRAPQHLWPHLGAGIPGDPGPQADLLSLVEPRQTRRGRCGRRRSPRLVLHVQPGGGSSGRRSLAGLLRLASRSRVL